MILTLPFPTISFGTIALPNGVWTDGYIACACLNDLEVGIRFRILIQPFGSSIGLLVWTTDPAPELLSQVI